MIERIATSQRMQRLISKTSNPKFYEKLNNNLPMLETTIATIAYSASIALNNKIEKERKPSMQYQNIICGTSGIILSSKVNKFINKHKVGICNELAKRNIDKVNNIIKGFQVALPLIIFSTILRFIIPVISVPISTKIEEIRKDKNNESRRV